VNGTKGGASPTANGSSKVAALPGFPRIKAPVRRAIIIRHSCAGPPFALSIYGRAVSPINYRSLLGRGRYHDRTPWGTTYVGLGMNLNLECFRGLALPEQKVGEVFRDFCKLPEEDLLRTGRELGLNKKAVDRYGWEQWLDGKGQTALLSALYSAEWRTKRGRSSNHTLSAFGMI
jgi:hypothetical protein